VIAVNRWNRVRDEGLILRDGLHMGMPHVPDASCRRTGTS